MVLALSYRPVTRLIMRSTIPTTRRMWISPPNVKAVMIPSSHKMIKMIAIVSSIGSAVYYNDNDRLVNVLYVSVCDTRIELVSCPS